MDYLEYTNNQESPESYHLWTGISVIAGTLGRNVWLDRGAYTIYPNLYIIVIGETAECRKSVSTGMGINILREITDVNIIQGRITPEAILKEINHKTSDLNGNITTNSTLYLYSSELGTLLGTASYVEELIILLTEMWMCTTFDFVTKNRGKIKVENPCVNLLGATIPAFLQSGFKGGKEGGILNRVIFVPEKKRRHREPWPYVDHGKKRMLIDDLFEIHKLNGEVKLSHGALTFFNNWYMNKPDADSNSLSDEFVGREHDIALKLAIIFSISRNDSLIVEEDQIIAGIKLVEQQRNTASSTLIATGITDDAKIGLSIIKILEKNGPLPHSNMLKRIYGKVRDARHFALIIDTLAQQELIEVNHLGTKVVYSLKNKI